MSCGERVAGDSRGLVGAMTLTSTQTGLVLTIRTSAATSLSAPQQDRGCTSPTSFSEVDRSHPAPHDLVVKLKPHELVVKLKTSCLLLTSASAIDTSEVGSSASRCSISILAPPPALSLIAHPPLSRQVGLSNIVPRISDAADSDAATGSTPAVRARALSTPPTLPMSLLGRA